MWPLPSSIFLIKSEGHPRQFEGLFYLSRGREKFLSWGRKFLSSLTMQRYKKSRCKTIVSPDYFSKKAILFLSNFERLFACVLTPYHRITVTSAICEMRKTKGIIIILYIIIIIYNIKFIWLFSPILNPLNVTVIR